MQSFIGINSMTFTEGEIYLKIVLLMREFYFENIILYFIHLCHVPSFNV